MGLFLFVLMIAVVMLLWLLEVKLGEIAFMGKNAGARVSGPLFSMSASGTIGKAVTYGTWKGRPWARVWFKPQNPNADKQVNVRTAMTLLVAFWGTAGGAIQEAFNVYAVPFAMSGFNKFVSRGMDAYIAQLGSATLPTHIGLGGVPPTEEWAWT